MTRVRHAAVAGQFYPADARELRETVTECIAEARTHGPAPKAVIAPHAGYIYSGPIAGSAYARLAADRATIRRIILLGPSHRVPFLGLAAPSVEHFETPLGLIPIDRESIAAVSSLPQVVVFDRAHEGEHSLEVHLPFLQVALDEFTLVPFAVGDASPQEVAEVLNALWGGPETRIVISSDLSHYLDYDTAARRDRATSRAIEALKYEEINTNDACGCYPVCGLLAVARERGMHAETVDLRSSGDTAGPRNHVVGYGAYVFS
jgi:AmmeMemoRadiSam system protein B